MKIFSLHAVIVSVIVELVCSLSLSISNVNIQRFQRISNKLSNHNLLHKQRRKYITYLSFLHKNKNYFVERLSNVKTYSSSKNSSNSPEVDKF